MNYNLFKILGADNEWHDFSDLVSVKGVSWSRLDRNASGIDFTLDKNLHRKKITHKRKITYRIMGAPSERYAELDDCLSQPEFQVMYAEIHGIMTKRFICTHFDATLDYFVETDQQIYSHSSGGSFVIEEI